MRSELGEFLKRLCFVKKMLVMATDPIMTVINGRKGCKVYIANSSLLMCYIM